MPSFPAPGPWPPHSRFSPLAGLLLVAGTVLLAGVFFQALSWWPARYLTGTDWGTFIADFGTHPEHFRNGQAALLLTQALASFGMFVAGPLLYWHFFEKQPLQNLSPGRFTALAAGLAVAALVFIIPLNGYLYTATQSLPLPGWMTDTEGRMAGLTRTLTRFNGPAALLAGLFVIALLPAIGEELLFRGLVQNGLERLLGHPAAAIWATAAVFSAIHMQFVGFLPRLLLGALFGYFYARSRHLLVPIAAHFFNNAFTLLLMYAQQHRLAAVGEAEDAGPLLAGVSATATLLTLWLAERHFKPTTNNTTA